jgi:hypothetical protein
VQLASSWRKPLTQSANGQIAADPSQSAATPVTTVLYEKAGNGESKVEVAKAKRLDFFS